MQFEEDTFIKFGTALPVLEEEDVQSRKPINVEDQIVVDENGRRRFHGAFTGGFSAGFWNTVGSLEGWKPQEFKSSRQEKATRKRQRVEDFMDEEDKGEFGIAPQRVQTKEDYTKQESSSTKKPKLPSSSTSIGAIPGVPVLQTLLQPSRDNIATRLLKQMGWKEGQGIGARQTKGEKKRAQSRNQKELYIMEKYGCDLGDRPSTSHVGVEQEEDSDPEEEITFAPDDFDPFLAAVKENTFGLGYSGLDRNPVLGKRFNLFQPLEILDKNNKKLSISGQAFGVGAFEAEDDDIYARDDMTKYDFSLEDKKKGKAKKPEVLAIQQGALDGFEAPQSSERGKFKNKVYKVTLPRDYHPRNWTERRSRFDRLPEEMERELVQQNSYKLKGLGRHDLNPDQRSVLLNEPGTSKSATVEAPVKESPRNKFLDMINKKYESFEKSAEIVHETLDLDAKKALEEAKKKTEGMPTIRTDSKTFRPFPQNPEKQKRYDKFCEFPLASDEEMTKFLATIQPVELSQWDREMEKKEFVQARKLFRPLDGLMLDRFVTETELNLQKSKDEEEKKKITDLEGGKESGTGEKQVQMKRIKAMWKPCALLCKRFNVPEPFGGAMIDEKPKETKQKYSVFDYLEVSVNKREAFITPVIRPQKSKEVKVEDKDGQKVEVDPKEGNSKTSVDGRLSAKELFEIELKKTIAAGSSKVPIVDTSVRPPPLPQVPQKEKTRERAKTELEQKSIALKDTHPAEKKDLFKAIFDSSDSEDEGEKATGNKDQDNPEGSSSKPDISELLKKSANEINILRNNSPPRGIFANLFKKPTEAEAVPSKESAKEGGNKPPAPELEKPEEQRKNDPPKIIFRKKEERETISKDNADDEQFFGPKPPPKRDTGPAASSTSSLFDVLPARSEDKLDRRLSDALQGKDLRIVEKWIEKDKVSSKKKKSKDKKAKKHKKEKKHKKDKKNKR